MGDSHRPRRRGTSYVWTSARPATHHQLKVGALGDGVPPLLRWLHRRRNPSARAQHNLEAASAALQACHCRRSPRRQQRRNVNRTRRMPRVAPRLETKALPPVQGSSPSDRRQRSTRIVCQDFSQSNRLSTSQLSVAQGIMSCRVAIRIFLAMYHSVGMCFRDSLRMFSLRIVDMKIQGVAAPRTAVRRRPRGIRGLAAPRAAVCGRPGCSRRLQRVGRICRIQGLGNFHGRAVPWAAREGSSRCSRHRRRHGNFMGKAVGRQLLVLALTHL